MISKKDKNRLIRKIEKLRFKESDKVYILVEQIKDFI